MSKNVQNRPINDHDYDSLSREAAYAGNMRKICRIFCQIPHISPKKVLHILRKFSAINQHP